jgi:hypothetical protein
VKNGAFSATSARARGVVARPRRGALAFALALAAAAGAARAQPPPPGAGDCETVFVISNGFHSSLAVPTSAAEAVGLPTFGGPWTEFGWGEAGAYQAPRLTARNVARVILAPGPSAMLIAPLRDRPDRLWSEGVVEFGLSRAGLRAVMAGVAAEPRRDAAGRLIVLSRQRGGVFLAAGTPFRVWRMCNAWASERLRRAGLPIGRAFTADGLIRAVDAQPTCAELATAPGTGS